MSVDFWFLNGEGFARGFGGALVSANWSVAAPWGTIRSTISFIDEC